MVLKTIPLSHLEADPKGTLNECADSGSVVIVELPDHRLVAMQPLDPAEDDDLINDLLETNPAFRNLVAESKAGSKILFSVAQGVRR